MNTHRRPISKDIHDFIEGLPKKFRLAAHLILREAENHAFADGVGAAISTMLGGLDHLLQGSNEAKLVALMSNDHLLNLVLQEIRERAARMFPDGMVPVPLEPQKRGAPYEEDEAKGEFDA